MNQLNIYVDKMAPTYYEIGLQLGVPNEQLKLNDVERC